MIGDVNNLIGGVFSSGLNPQSAVPASVGSGSAAGGRGGNDDDSFSHVGKAFLFAAPLAVIGITGLFRRWLGRGNGPQGPDAPSGDDHSGKSDAERLAEARALKLEVMRINRAVRGLSDDEKKAKRKEAYGKCLGIKQLVTAKIKRGKTLLIEGGETYSLFADKQLASLRDLGVDKKYELESLKQRLADAQQRLATADADRKAALEKQAAEAQRQLEAARTEGQEALRQQGETARQQLESMTAERDSASQGSASLQQQLGEEQQNHAETQAQLAQAREEIGRAGGHAAVMEGMRDGAVQAEEAAKAEASKARQALRGMTAERDRLQQQLEVKAQEYESARQNLEDVLGRYGAQRQMLTDTENQRSRLWDDLTSQGEELNRVKAELTAAQKKIGTGGHAETVFANGVGEIPKLPDNYGSPEYFEGITLALAGRAENDPAGLFAQIQEWRQSAVQLTGPANRMTWAAMHEDYQALIGAVALLNASGGNDALDPAAASTVLVAVRDDAFASLQGRGAAMPDLNLGEILILDEDVLEEVDELQAVAGEISVGFSNKGAVRALIESMLDDMWADGFSGKMKFNTLLNSILSIGFNDDRAVMLRTFNGATHPSAHIEMPRMTKILDESVSLRPEEVGRIAAALRELNGADKEIADDDDLYVTVSAMLPYAVDKVIANKQAVTSTALQFTVCEALGMRPTFPNFSNVWTQRIGPRIKIG